MRFINRSGDNPNFLVGIFLLLLLAVFMGPNVLPRIITSVSPIIDEAIPCAWLNNGTDLANHQSLIGRAAADALALEVRPKGIPLNPEGVFEIDIVVINRSLGTVPFVYNANQINIGDDGSSGLGIIFDPGNFQAANSGRTDPTSFPEQNIKVMGPRQRCIHSINLPVSQLDTNVRSGNAQVRAFYRINTPGQVVQAASTLATPIYPDQGLDVVSGGFAESPAVQLVVNIG